MIVPISTPSAQAVVGATKEIPVVFTAVTDPVGAKLVADPKHPGGNVTGMSDLSPIGKHLDLIKEIMPAAKTLGVIYNPGEANSLTLLELLKAEAPARGLAIEEAPAPKSSDVLPAAQSLVGKVDAIYVPTDNTVVTALEAIVQVGRQNKLPVFAGDTDSVPRGAIAALGFNYGDVGRQTGKIVVRVLKGEKPGDIPVEGVEITELFVNPGRPRRWGSSCRRRWWRAPRPWCSEEAPHPDPPPLRGRGSYEAARTAPLPRRRGRAGVGAFEQRRVPGRGRARPDLRAGGARGLSLVPGAQLPRPHRRRQLPAGRRRGGDRDQRAGRTPGSGRRWRWRRVPRPGW